MSRLQYELALRNLRFATQRVVPIVYKGMTLDATYRINLIVEVLVVIEVRRLINARYRTGTVGAGQ